MHFIVAQEAEKIKRDTGTTIAGICLGLEPGVFLRGILSPEGTFQWFRFGGTREEILEMIETRTLLDKEDRDNRWLVLSGEIKFSHGRAFYKNGFLDDPPGGEAAFIGIPLWEKTPVMAFYTQGVCTRVIDSP